MKETLYGWYPSVRNVYQNAARFQSSNNPYHLEALYKFRTSEYYSESLGRPLSTTGHVKRSNQPSRAQSRCSTRPSAQHHSMSPAPDSGFFITPVQLRQKPVPIPTPKKLWRNRIEATPFSVAESPFIEIPGQNGDSFQVGLSNNQDGVGENGQLLDYDTRLSPTSCYEETLCHYNAMHRPTTSPNVLTSKPPTTPRPHTTKFMRIPQSSHSTPTLMNAQVKAQSSVTRGDRIKSAPVGRMTRPHAKTLSSRPVSAHPVPVSDQPCADSVEDLQTRFRGLVKDGFVGQAPLDAFEDTVRMTETKRACSAPVELIPRTPPTSPTDITEHGEKSCEPKVDSEYDVFEVDREYEDILDKYGWRAEIHGDPYGLKKIPERFSYTVTVDDPVIPPDPPDVHMENYDTFFLNTIPHRPMTYTIDKEWMSEALHSKRMQLQKRDGGYKYRWKNYAFVY